MKLTDVAKNLSRQTDRRLDRRLKVLLRVNPHYRDLDKEDREIILDLLSKYKKKKRRGIKISDYAIRKDLYNIYQNRLKMGLTRNDVDKIKELLNSLKD